MECHDVQLIVSEKMDGVSVSEERLAEAKAHCATCATCAAYVRALSRIQDLPTPPVPDGLERRIMDAVRDEAARIETQRSLEEVELAETAAVAPMTVEPATRPGLADIVRTLLDTPERRRAAAIWGGAAAALLLVATVTTVSGIRAITAPQDEKEALRSAGEVPGSVMADMAAESSEYGAEMTDQAAAPDNATQVIAVSGVVYRFTGPVSGVASETLSPVGSTMTALDSGDAAVARQVLGVNDPARVYVANDKGELLGFDRVTRLYNGRQYVHASGDLTSFGVWPSLPAGIAAPSNPNGMPEYVESGTDSLGVRVYRPAAAGPESGFLVAPGTGPSDPAAGNPGWTWWVPAR